MIEDNASSADSDGTRRQCPACDKQFSVELMRPPTESPCPACGSLQWFVEAMTAQVQPLAGKQIAAVELHTTDKPLAIRELVATAAGQNQLDSSQESAIYEAIMNREELGPTGIGRGFAFPHTRFKECETPTMAVGFSKEGIEYESLDGLPVHTIALLISPASDPSGHLRTLEGISRNLRDLL